MAMMTVPAAGRTWNTKAVSRLNMMQSPVQQDQQTNRGEYTGNRTVQVQQGHLGKQIMGAAADCGRNQHSADAACEN